MAASDGRRHPQRMGNAQRLNPPGAVGPIVTGEKSPMNRRVNKRFLIILTAAVGTMGLAAIGARVLRPPSPQRR